MVMENKKIKSFSIQNIYPFYIDNINDKFFTSLNHHPNKKFVTKILPKIKKTLEEEELEKFIEIDNLAKYEKVSLMLNLALKKIVSKTGSTGLDILKVQSYDKFNEPMYIKSIEFDKDIEIVSDNLSERRYSFVIETNPESYLYSYLKKITLSFYLDDENKILSGGFSLTLFENTENQNIESEKIIENIYLSNLVRHYIIKQLYPISLNNILEIVNEYKPETNTNKFSKKNTTKIINDKKNSGLIDFKQITAKDLKDNWIELIERKYLRFKKDCEDSEIKNIKENLFFSILITTMITLSLYEELKIYFTNEKPELILNILDKPALIKEDPNQNPEIDFYELSKFLKLNYFHKDIIKKNKFKKIKKIDDIIKVISEHQATIEYESFGSPTPIYDIQIDDSTPFVSSKKLITEDMNTRIFYLLTISPELFGMDQYAGFFIEYGQLLKVIEKTRQNLNISDSFKAKIENSRCEINNNYVTYLSEAPAILLIKNEPINLFNNYFWAEIYAQSRIWMRNDIEYDFNNDKIKKNTFFYREKIRSLENLSFDWYDEFYGLPEIKGIVKKIDTISNLKNSIDLLINKMKQQDSINKKDSERKTMVLAFVVATIIGFINFFGMVFTILTVDDIDAGLTTTNIIVISISSILALGLVGVIIYLLVNMYKRNKRN